MKPEDIKKTREICDKVFVNFINKSHPEKKWSNTMKFEEAIRELRNGNTIRRKSWPVLGCIQPLLLTSSKVTFDYECLHADDWEVLEEHGKTFPEVFQAFKEGKKIKRKSWISISFIENDVMSIYGEDLLATDWMLVE